jgi:transcriptional regulator with XRE-family HTH domain
MKRTKSGQTSLRQLAKEPRVSASYLSQVTHGKRPASEKVLGRLCRMLSNDWPNDVVRASLFSYNPKLLGNRLAVGQRTLDPLAEVRILVPQPDTAQVLPDTMSSTITMIMPAETPSRKLQPSKRIRLPQNHHLLPAQRASRRTWYSPHRLRIIASQ